MELEAKAKENDPLTFQVIGCAMEVHRVLGPGLLESVYERCLAHELTQVGVPFVRQKELPVEYKNAMLDRGFRLDLLVAGELIVELKSVDTLLPVHEAQLLTYLRLARLREGLLIDFNVSLLKQGIKRRVL